MSDTYLYDVQVCVAHMCTNNILCFKLISCSLSSILCSQRTDVLLVKVQDTIEDLRDVANDETVAKEVAIGKESIKDADKMKQVK